MALLHYMYCGIVYFRVLVLETEGMHICNCYCRYALHAADRGRLAALARRPRHLRAGLLRGWGADAQPH